MFRDYAWLVKVDCSSTIFNAIFWTKYGIQAILDGYTYPHTNDKKKINPFIVFDSTCLA